MKLSILICTTISRKDMFVTLYEEFMRQIVTHGNSRLIEVLYIQDNKEMSVGTKRQRLLEMSKGEWIVYFDDDDYPYHYYISEVWKAINTEGVDCVGMNVAMTTNGKKPQKCCHRLLYPSWAEKVDGWDYVRNITHFNPILRSKAMMVGFNDKRFGEDKEYSDIVSLLCSKEAYIEKPLFHYRYTTNETHKERYGIK